MSDETLRLRSDGLLSKWGFNDGDMPESVCDYCEAHGINYESIDWRSTLVRIVRAHLLPALGQDVEVYEIETIHNPIRATTVDGKPVDERGEPVHALTPEYIDVPMADVLLLAAYEQTASVVPMPTREEQTG